MTGSYEIADIVQKNNLSAPRILCLHGGGTNAEVMRLQCRSLVRELKSSFRLVFVDAPFFCPPHANIVTVYGGYGPFRRWLRWQSEQAYVDDETIISEIEYQIRTAMEHDDAHGATGEWVGLLGFSQGAKIAASMLYESQLRQKEGEEKPVLGFAGGMWKFAVLMAGRAPMVALREPSDAPKNMARPSSMLDFGVSTPLPKGMEKLRLPTVHVHGLADEGLHYHQFMRDEYCELGTTKLIEWNGDHRLPIKTMDVRPVVTAIKAFARDEGIVLGDD